MESRLVLDGGDAAAGLASLTDWLRRDGELRGRIRLVRQPPVPGQMGSLVEVLAVAVGAGGAVTVLAKSLAVWLAQPRRSTVRIKVIRSDGTKVEISAEHLRRAGELEGLLRDCLHEDD